MFQLKNALIPYPQTVVSDGTEITIGQIASASFTLIIQDNNSPVFEEATQLLRQALVDRCCITDAKKDAAYTITLSTNADDAHFTDVEKAEAYYIEITSKSALLCGKDDAGTFYAAVTFAQLLHTVGTDIRLPICTILDYPDFARRGNFIECRYGTEFLTLDDWKRAVDYFASMKNNQLTIGVYGCWSDQYDNAPAQYLYLPIKKYPALQTPKTVRYFSVHENKWVCRENQLPTMFEEDYLGELIAYAKRKNVTVKPLFNSLGHNRLIPTVFPEVSAKTEDGVPTGYGFCTRSTQTIELLFDIYDEIIERYLLPNGIDSIQIGMDEVGGPHICHCEKCKDSTHQELMIEFIIKICKHLKERGMKHIYVYHDMLYNSFNCVNESLKALFIREGIYDEVVIDWWTYEDPDHLFWDKADGVNGLFRSTIKPFTGYYHWTIPTDNNPNIRACAQVARKHGFEGMEAYGALDYCFDKNFLCLAESAWNTEKALDVNNFDKRYSFLRFPNSSGIAQTALQAMAIAMQDETHASYMNSACYKLEYYFYCYRKKADPPLRPFPQAVFDSVIFPEPERFRDYLQMLSEKAAIAVDIFENRSKDCGIYNDIWLLSAKHYQALADEYLTLWHFYNANAAGALDSVELLCELDRLILQREKVMALAEKVRMPATQYTYLRNMCVFRQFYLELREHVKSGGAFELALPESDIFRALR